MSVTSRRLWSHLAVAALAALGGVLPSAVAAQAGTATAQWDLRDLYPSPAAWTESYERTGRAVGGLARYRGTLGSAEGMLAALAAISDARREILRLYTYAALRADEDLRIAANSERRQQAQTLFTQYSEAIAWLAPEILQLGEAQVRGFLGQSPELARRFDFYLRETLRAAPHTLGLEAESVLAATGNVLAQPNAVFQQLVDAELPYPTIEIAGAKVRLATPEYEKYRSSPDRALRKTVFDAFWGAFASYQGTLGANLTTQVMGSVFSARARRFDSALQQALFEDNMPEQVYRTLVAQANAGLPTLHRYLKLRQRLLGISGELAYYDNYPPLFKLARPLTFSIEDSRRLTRSALAPLGPEYLALFDRGVAAPWSDMRPRPGKASGAYVIGSAYDVHPYVLLNHNDDFPSLSTFAHEWGHAVHTLLANAAQPFEKASYSTFIAESASIANELLLADFLVRTATSREEKLFYLGEQLESIRQTFFRQVMFAEFQLAIHEAREKGQPLSGAALTEQYCTLLKRYYGAADGVMTIDPLYCNEWAYVPHFYYGFYVWQYATSMVGAAQFVRDLQGPEADAARARFIALLKAGGSDDAYQLYRRAGVDLAQAAPYQALLGRMNRVMDEIEALEKAPR